MRDCRVLRWWRERDGWEKLAIIVWTAVILATCGRGLLRPRSHSVYPIYAAAAQRWLAGDDLYVAIDGYDHYRYSPLVAGLLVPFSLLPDALGGLLWRGLNAGVYLGALGWWSRSGLPLVLTGRQRAILFLLAVPLSIGSLNNGQSNALVLGLLLIALTAVASQRWGLAGGCVALACCFKLYPIAIGLLLAAVYPRRFAPRFGAALVLGLLLPFVMQHPAYVAGQYACWAEHLLTYDRHSAAVGLWYRDVLLLARAGLVPLDARVYLVLQLVAAAGMAGLCVAARRVGWGPRRLVGLVLALGCCWMTAFGPATESCTYILLAPPLAWALLEAWLTPRPPWVRGLLLASAGLLLTAQAAVWFPGSRAFRDLGPQPFAALLFLGCQVAVTVREICWLKEPLSCPRARLLSSW